MQREIYKSVILNKLKRLDFRWFFHKLYTYLFLKTEAKLGTGYAPPPLACGIVITENCNMRCPMCVLPQHYMKNPNNKPLADWNKVIDQLHDLGLGGIAISGGEPTMRSDFGELLKHARRHDTTVTLNSNLATLSQEQIDTILDSKLSNVNVSIDSGREEINDQLRGGKNVLNRVIRGINALGQARDTAGQKFSITAVTTLSDLNLDELDLLFGKISQSKADRICFIPLHDIKDGITYLVNCKKARPDLYDQLRVLSQKYALPLENSASYLKGFYNVMSGGVMKERCNAGYTHLVIGSDLKIYRCIPYMNTGRSLFDWDPHTTPLKKLWNSPKWRQDRLAALTCKECFWDCHAEQTYLVPM